MCFAIGVYISQFNPHPLSRRCGVIENDVVLEREKRGKGNEKGKIRKWKEKEGTGKYREAQGKTGNDKEILGRTGRDGE